MIKPTRPKPSRFKYVAMLAGALAVAAFPPIGLTAVATAEKVWDIETYDDCTAGLSYDQMKYSINEQKLFHQKCCEYSGGIFIDDGYIGKCVAPPAEPASGSRQLPGNVHIPSDIATAPTVTKNPPRPIRVPSDIATVSTVSQGNELAS
jgi:hypothetical protein